MTTRPLARDGVRRGRVAGLLVAVALAGGAAGCSGEDEASAPPLEIPGTSSGTSTAAPGEPGDAGTTGVPESSATDDGAAAQDGAAQLMVVADAPADPAQHEVWQAYVDFWEADVTVLADPALPLEPLAERLSPPQDARTTDFIGEQRSRGERSVGEIVLDPQVVAVADGQALISDCLDDSGLVSVDSGGTEVPGSAGARTPVSVELVEEGGRWLVADIQASDADLCT